MSRRLKILRYGFGLLSLVFLQPLQADSGPRREKLKTTSSKFIRLRRDNQSQPVAMETSTVRYQTAAGDGGLVVDLIGVVHIGDKGYYEKLNRQLEEYDVLLYELVAPPGTRVPRKGLRTDNPLAFLQQAMKTVLALDSQTEQIDYTRKNFVHADLSPDQMAEKIRSRGDDGFTLFLSVAADLMRQQNLQEQVREKVPGDKEADIDFSSLLLDSDGPVKLKKILAQQLVNLESGGTGLGTTLNTILIADRNEAVMKVLQKELARGKKKVGVFYGAAHMPDMEKRLRDGFGLQPVGQPTWLTAWDLTPRERGLEGVLDLLKLFDK